MFWHIGDCYTFPSEYESMPTDGVQLQEWGERSFSFLWTESCAAEMYRPSLQSTSGIIFLLIVTIAFETFKQQTEWSIHCIRMLKKSDDDDIIQLKNLCVF